MYPILFRVGDIPIDSYVTLMVLGYIAALGAIFYVTPKGGDARKTGSLDRPQVWDLFIVMVVSSVIGAKLGHVFFEAPGHTTESGAPINSLIELLQDDPWHWARLGESGYVWYGGMLGALLVAVFYFYRRPHLKGWLYADAFAPAIMLGAALGRMGCFLAGCCYGDPTDGPFGIQFPRLPSPVHPTQLYDATIAAALGLFLLWRFGRRRFHGENIALLLMTYPVMRATTEIFRGDAERGEYGAISTSQIISIPLFFIGVWLYFHRRKSPIAPTPPEE
nr:phosphatidylglycerol--prolipoprotein diacylglyceryl transferase-like [Nerophis lumbriciformis]